MPKGYERGRARFNRGFEDNNRRSGEDRQEYDGDGRDYDPNTPAFRGNGGEYDPGPRLFGEKGRGYGPDTQEYDSETPAFGGGNRGYGGDGREYDDRDYDDGGYDGDGEEYEDDRGYYDGDGGGGWRRYSKLIIVLAAVAVIVLVFILVKNLFGASPTGGQGQPTASPNPTESPADTAVIQVSETPLDTVEPSDSPTLEPTDTEPPDETATEEPTDTPKPTKTPAPTHTDEPVDTMTVPAIEGKADVTDNLSLRKTESSSADILVKIPKDGKFTILEVSSKDAAWLKVKYSGKTGYVLAKYVSIGSDGKGKVCTIATAMINVRSGAGTSHDIIGVLKSGDTVYYLSETTVTGTVWCKIKIGSKTGYVSKKYCRVETTS